MADGDVIRIEEHVVEGKRLGRHINHDPASRAFNAMALVPPEIEGQAAQVDRLWHRYYGPLQQGDIGSCTGNAGVGSLMTSPNHKANHRYAEKDALKVYSLATTLDDAPGQYPPDDTGSSGLAALKAMKQLGMIGGYRWTFAFADALTVLSTVGPIMVGVNWYDSFDNPGAHGLVSLPPGAQVRGGHEFEILGIIWGQRELRAINSWGGGWGDRGYFTIPFDVFDRLLNEQGDVAMIDPTVKAAA